MKKILLALTAVMAMSSAAIAQPGHGERDWRHDGRHNSHRFERIPDRVERTVIRRDGQRIVVTTRYKCVEQRRGRCLDWDRTVTRRVVNR